jgi:putative tryptophan/tyrosine transport system substrate-binding protein
MRRREFMTLIGGAVALPTIARAQQPAKMKRVAMIHPATKPEDMRIGGDPNFSIIFEEIKRLGYVEGVNLIVDRYSAEGRFDRFPEIAREVVATRPGVIFALSDPLSLALKSETRTIPIVAWTGDPINAGLVSNLARPGGNLTGVSVDAGVGIGSKLLQLLAEAVGKLSNVRELTNPTNWERYKSFREDAERLKIPLQLEPLRAPVNESSYRRIFETMRQDRVDAVLILADAENYTYRHLLGLLAKEFRLPAMSLYTDTTEAGALMSYAFDLKAADRRIAAQIVEILNGGNPAEMPYIQEKRWELAINLKAAKELGLEIPAGLVAQADRVIE